MEKNPTLLSAYGGFEISKSPKYLSRLGRLWLAQGGVYVSANIRGGWEFGPEWHQAAWREHRQRSVDDFIAVAEDLIQSKLTTAKRLGIVGGSLGGLLMGNALVQRPKLFRAVLAFAPRLNLMNYLQHFRGYAKLGEYGYPYKDVRDDQGNVIKEDPVFISTITLPSGPSRSRLPSTALDRHPQRYAHPAWRGAYDGS